VTIFFILGDEEDDEGLLVSSVFLTQCNKSTILYILILATYGKFARKNKMLSLGVASRRHARVLAAGLPCQDHVYITTDKSVCFHNHGFNEMPFFAICSQYQNVEETEIYVCALFGHLLKENAAQG